MLIYLALPYSHPDDAVRNSRYELACRVAAELMQAGHVVYSPIAHSHPIAAYLPEELLLDHRFWMAQCLPMIDLCDEVWVLDCEGTAESRGVAAEVKYATEGHVPVKYLLDGGI